MWLGLGARRRMLERDTASAERVKTREEWRVVGGMGWNLLTNDPPIFKIWLKKQSWDDLNHAKHTHTPHVLTRSLFIPLFFPPHLAGLRAINSWNWAFANSFIQSLVERQNAHSLWCAPLTGRYWKWWMVAKTTLHRPHYPKHFLMFSI